MPDCHCASATILVSPWSTLHSPFAEVAISIATAAPLLAPSTACDGQPDTTPHPHTWGTDAAPQRSVVMSNFAKG